MTALACEGGSLLLIRGIRGHDHSNGDSSTCRSVAISIQQSLDDERHGNARSTCCTGDDSEGHSSTGYLPLVHNANDGVIEDDEPG